jgi:hypothetical protein
MTDEHSPEQPASDSPGGEDVSFVGDENLDDILAQAAGLAADLSRELGAREDPSESTDGPTAPGNGEDRPTDLDATPQDIGQPVQTNAAESDSAPAPESESAPSTPEPVPSPDDPVSDSPYAVPKLTAEFTRPEDSPETAPAGSQERAANSQKPVTPPSAVGSPANQAPRPGGSSKPGVVGSGTMGVVGTPSPAPADSNPAPPPGAPSGQTDLAPGTPESPQIASPLRQAVARASPLVWSVCDRALSLLEVIDRPLAKLGSSIRRAIGWFAIATAATAVIAYLISLL